MASNCTLMAVPVAFGTSVQIGTPRESFAVAGMAGAGTRFGFGAPNAATRDGQRFLLNLTVLEIFQLFGTPDVSSQLRKLVPYCTFWS